MQLIANELMLIIQKQLRKEKKKEKKKKKKKEEKMLEPNAEKGVLPCTPKHLNLSISL